MTSTAAGLLALVGGVVMVVAAADVFVDGLLGVGRKLGVAPFVLTVALSGFETENLAAGIATNAKGLPAAAAGTFLGGVTFLALAVAGLGGVIAPMTVELPRRFAGWTAVAPLPLLAFAVDGRLSRVEGGVLVLWAIIALIGAARTGRTLLAGEDDDQPPRRPVARLLAGLAVLTGGGWLLGDGLRSVVRHLGISQALLGNTALAATVEPKNSPASPSPPAADDLSSRSATSPARSSTSPRSTPASSPSSSRSPSTTTPPASTSPPPPQAQRSSPPCSSRAAGSDGRKAPRYSPSTPPTSQPRSQSPLDSRVSAQHRRERRCH